MTFELKEGLKITSSDFWYDLTSGGYIDPRKICKNPEDAKKILDAINVILDFENDCNEQIEDFYE